MGYFSEQLREYLANRTPEQKAEDEALMIEYAGCGPVLEDFNEIMSNVANLKDVAERCINHVLSGEFEKAQTAAMEYNELKKFYERKD